MLRRILIGCLGWRGVGRQRVASCEGCRGTGQGGFLRDKEPQLLRLILPIISGSLRVFVPEGFFFLLRGLRLLM